MLKKGHKIPKTLTMAQLFEWTLEGATFKCSRRAHWKTAKGRMRPKISNRHQYIKKKGRLPDVALKEKKSSLLQA